MSIFNKSTPQKEEECIKIIKTTQQALTYLQNLLNNKENIITENQIQEWENYYQLQNHLSYANISLYKSTKNYNTLIECQQKYNKVKESLLLYVYKHNCSVLQEKNDSLNQQLRTISSVLTDEHGNAINLTNHLYFLQTKLNELQSKIQESNNQLYQIEQEKQNMKSNMQQQVNAEMNSYVAQVQNQIREKENEKNSLLTQIEELKKDYIELKDEILLQDYGLYRPTYSFATADGYKNHLLFIREQQKNMIKNNIAATCSTDWTVNGSKRDGQKMVNDNIKQVLITFNTECENAISQVKFNNFEKMKERIQKIFDKLNKLNASSYITISNSFLDLKIQELTLAYEYARKKEEEKEHIKQLKAIEKENLKVQKEIEEERKRIKKEQKHYQQQLQLAYNKINNETNETKKLLLQEKINDFTETLQELDKSLTDVDYREANQKAGYVYVISNIGSFGENIYKIGMTRRLDPMERIDELSSASVPFPFDVHALIFSDDAPKLESNLHQMFANRKVNLIKGRKEFFNVSLEEIENAVRQYHDKTVDFNYIPYAEQYRESLRLKNQ